MKAKLYANIDTSIDNIAFRLLQLYIICFLTGTYLGTINSFMLVLFAMTFVATLISKLPRLQLPRLFIPLLILVVYAFITTIWASDKSRAMDVNVTILKCVAFAWCIVALCTNRKRIESLMICYIIGCYVLGIWCVNNLGFQGLLSLGSNSIRLGDVVTGVLINSNKIGVTNAMAIPFIFYISEEKEKALYKLFLIPPCVIVVLTASRTAIILLLVGLLLSVLFIHKNTKFFKLLLFLSIIGIVIYIAAKQGWLGYAMERMVRAFDTISGVSKENSTLVRITLIENGLNWFIKKPIFGYGSGQFNVLAFQEMGYHWSPHNTYTQILVSYGIIGFVLWQGTFFRILKKLFANKQDLLSIAINIAIICWLVENLLSHTLTSKEAYFLFGLGIACVNVMSERSKTKDGH